MLLLSLILYLTSTGVNAAEIEYVPAGYTTPTSGYFLTEQAGRDVLEGWSSDRAAKEAYKAALDDMYSEWQVFKDDMTAQITAVKDSLTAEREANRIALKKARAPGLGVFGGIGFTSNGDIKAVVGIGLVYKVF